MTTIALDFDGTTTTNPEFWYSFATDLADSYSFRVVIVTYRDERHDRCELLDEFEKAIPVYYTRGIAKRFYMEHFGEPVDIWIDDKPQTILENSAARPAWLREWRESGGPAG